MRWCAPAWCCHRAAAALISEEPAGGRHICLPATDSDVTGTEPKREVGGCVAADSSLGLPTAECCRICCGGLKLCALFVLCVEMQWHLALVSAGCGCGRIVEGL